MTSASSSVHVPALPQGVVTFLFTDIQGSTQLLHRLGDRYAEVLGLHHQLLREAFTRHHGHEVDTQGDAFFVAFSSVKEALAAARDAQQALHGHPWPPGAPVRVRMGLHTGEPLLVDGHYVGMDVHRAARIAASGHGEQVLVSARTLELAGSTPVKDLGEHRLKDLERPEHIYQLLIDGLPDAFAPLTSLGSPTNVPHHLGSLIGRATERRQLLQLVCDPAVRVVTVTGTGGTGKTRLSAAVALDALPAFPDGVFFVDLTTTSAPDLVTAAVSKVLEVDGEAGGLSTEASLEQHLGHRKLLLLLDNFEQVLDGAVAVSRVLEACDAVKVLATSRVPLAIHGEQEYPLDTLSLPTGDSLDQVAASDAVQLFTQKATEARPTFRLTEDNAAAVAQACRLLDGLPLAIELAAARTKLFTPQALVRRLDDRLGLLSGGAADSPIRHRALRTTIDWSYDLLSPAERRFFRDLGVFAGGVTFEAIEEILPTEESVLDLVSSLVNRSLLRQREDDDGETRFSMLQVLRDYSLEIAERYPDQLREVQERHAEYFLALARRVRGTSSTASPDEALLDRERDNLHSALEHWLGGAAAGDADAGNKALALAGALAYHWYLHGQVREGSRWLERALAAAVDPPAEDRARGLQMLGVLVQHTGGAARAVGLLEEARALQHEAGDLAREAACLNSLGAAFRYLLRLPEAQQRLEEAAAIRKQLGDAGGLVSINNNLGLVLMDQGRVEEARQLFADNLVVDRERDDTWGAACSMLNLGVAALIGGRPDEAAPLIGEAVRVFADEGDADGVAEALEACVGLAVANGRWMAAVRLAGAADACRTAAGLVVSDADRIMMDRWTTQAREQLPRPSYEQGWSEGAAMTPAQAEAYARSEVVGAGSRP